MPTLTTSVTATSTHEITIEPKVRKQLLTQLKAWEKAHLAEKAAAAEKKKHVAEIEKIQVQLGESTLAVDGYKTTLVPKMTHKLDKELYVRLGGKLSILEKATKEIPGKSYIKVTVPGAEERDYE